QIHAEERITGLEQGQTDRRVGLGARMRLDVHVIRIEKGLCPLDGQAFGHIHVLTATVVTLTGIALGVFVGKHGTLRLQDARAGVILGSNQLHMVFLTLFFILQRLPEFIVKADDAHGIAIHWGNTVGSVRKSETLYRTQTRRYGWEPL